MSVAFTLGLSTDLAGAVEAYFAKFHVLPPRNVTVTATSTPRGPVSFETLVRAIIASSDTGFVIVVHGHEDGSGLFLPLANRNRQAVGERATHDRLTRLTTIAARTPVRIDPDDRLLFGLRDDEIERLLDLRTQARAKGIQSIEFRGCNLGRDQRSVAAFREFFGAASFGAPKLHSLFGRFPTATGGDVMGNHSSTHSGTTLTFTQSLGGRNCHCCIGINDRRKPENGHVVAPDAATLDGWIAANFQARATRGGGERLPVHGLWKIPEITINTDIFANTDPSPVFPLAVDDQGRNEYARNVVYSP